jgi:Uma2 family endonuclease
MATDISANKLTYELYCLFPDDGNRHEIIDGSHYMNPSPNLSHQSVLGKLYRFLYEHIESSKKGHVFLAPTDVLLSKFDIVQPDLTVVLNDRATILTEANIQGTPSMVVEIISPGTAKYDRTLKKRLYQVAKVPEYWIVDIKNKRVEQYFLTNEKYEQLAQSENIQLQIVENVRFKSNDLWTH